MVATAQAGGEWQAAGALGQLFGSYVLWGVIASATFFLLWPALWIDPIGIFVKMYSEMTEYIGGHSNPNFFMGQITHDPGPLFYPIAYFFRTTPAALVGIVAHDRRLAAAPTAAGNAHQPPGSLGTLESLPCCLPCS